MSAFSLPRRYRTNPVPTLAIFGGLFMVCLMGYGFLSWKYAVENNNNDRALVSLRSGGTNCADGKAMVITISDGNGHSLPVKFHSRSSDDSIKEAIAATTGISVGGFGLKDSQGVVVAVSAGALMNGEGYNLVKLQQPDSVECSSDHTGVMHQVSHGFADAHGDHGVLDNGVVLSGKPARLMRVVVTCLGTGRYRTLSLRALESVRDHFGGDALVSLHLLTDNVTGVDKEFNPAFTPYREWPLSGLAKFEDILQALEKEIREADYFYFLDGDVRFQEDVRLADVAGDLVAVEHPMYPRNDWGWCVPGKITMCEYPYERKKLSACSIPDKYGKFKKTLRTGEHVFISNSVYLQSAFWGGKSEHILPALKDMKKAVDHDVAINYFSSIIQDERYVNWYFWKHMNDSKIEIRWLSPSYLFPYRSKGFGAWVLNNSRPIIVHGTAKAGKMLKGEHEIRIDGAGGSKGTCFDTFLGDRIGTYSCHDPEYRGGTQGFVWLDGKLRTTETVKLCVDGAGAKAGDPVLLKKCIDGHPGQQWKYDKEHRRLVSVETGLCMDPMRFDKEVYPQTKNQHKWPVSLQPCGKSNHQKLVLWEVDVEENAKHADKLRKAGKY